MIYKIVLLVAAALVGQVVGQSPPCVDDPDFRYNGQSNKDCKYVARRPQMCKKWQVKKNCKETCDYPCECEDGATFDWNDTINTLTYADMTKTLKFVFMKFFLKLGTSSA